ncbi:DUF6096 family protein [Diplocloster modestus]|uniref:Uncharacterized protein n=1 Tax=Diplocloster modestus TaxID=2850322 RepID=A0ABS6K212_9FIRM|nr:DUF6096 family protein [Diplocloster modestus]MBU9724441.1 hypothetical protein [Diplocloster modestus]
MGKLQGLDEEVIQEKEENVVSYEEAKTKRRPFHYWKIGEREYKLKLTTAMIGKLENKYRTNMLTLVSEDNIPPLSIMLTILQAAMAPWEHGKSYADVQKLYDRWIEDGGNQMLLFTGILMPTLAVSGFFTEKQAAAMLESLKDMDELI